MQVRPAVSRRYKRVRASLELALQAAVAAGIAWFIAHQLLHHVQPFFAPISAVIVLAVSVGQRMRRAIELVLGNAFGILFGEVLVAYIGRGAWQVSLAVFVAILAAIMFGGSSALVGQAASSAVLVVTFVTTRDYFFSRFIDALVGGGVGLAVMALLLPLNPLTMVSRAAGPILNAITTGLSATAAAITDRDAAEAQRALAALRDAESKLRALNDAIVAGKEISVFAPIRWGKRGALLQYIDAYNHIARTLRNSRVLTRRTVIAIQDGEPLPDALAVAVQSLADGASQLHRDLAAGDEPAATREDAIKGVRAASEAYGIGLGFSGSVIAAQVRSIASDLLRATGVEHEEATRQIRKIKMKVA